MKGIEPNYDSSQLKPFIKEGHWLHFNDSTYSKDIIVSAQLAKQLKLKLYDTIHIYFISSIDGSRNYRKLSVSAIYKQELKSMTNSLSLAINSSFARWEIGPLMKLGVMKFS